MYSPAFFLKVTLVKTKKFTQSRSLSFRKARKTDSIPLRILRFLFSLRETILISFHSCWCFPGIMHVFYAFHQKFPD